MNKIACVNGQFLPESEASISIFDRGFLFADGIYEAISVVDGLMLDVEPHMARLERSLKEVAMTSPYSREQIIAMLRELVQQNQFREGLLYFQITRGAAPRTFQFPAAEVEGTFIAFTMPMPLMERPEIDHGVKIISIPEQRWKRRDIKSVGMLAQCLGKQAAVEQGCHEAIMIEEDGTITEGTSSSFYIVKGNTLITRPLSSSILPGVTRRAVLALAKQNEIQVEERNFTLEEACGADEACLTAASNFVMPVVQIDEHSIGTGKPGPLVKKLRAIYIEEALGSAI